MSLVVFVNYNKVKNELSQLANQFLALSQVDQTVNNVFKQAILDSGLPLMVLKEIVPEEAYQTVYQWIKDISYMPSGYIPQKKHAMYGPEANYGERQERFVERSRETVRKNSDLLRDILSQEGDFAEIFPTLIQSLAEERRRIAEEENTPAADLFGRRAEEIAIDGIYSYTVLADVYEDYNVVALNHLREKMVQMKHTLKEFQQTNYKISETTLGRTFMYEIELLSDEELHKRGWTQSPAEEIAKFARNHQVFPNPDLSKQEFSATVFSLLKMVKAENLDLYKRDKMFSYVIGVRNAFPSPRLGGPAKNLASEYVLGTARMAIDGKAYALAQMFTWVYRDFHQDPLDRMVEKSTAIAIPQDPYLNPILEQECAKVFAEALQWDRSQEVSVLKNQVALLRYLFAQVSPFARGSAWIGEQLELLIYSYHGFEICRYSTRGLVDLEALTAVSVANYLEQYDKLVEIL